jgi:hypothetical protein
MPDGSITTFSGVLFRPLLPNPDDIRIADIAHALSQQYRFAGHTRTFYSVAEHSVRVSLLCRPDDALWGLLHDASEAFLTDVPAPPIQVKHGSWRLHNSMVERGPLHRQGRERWRWRGRKLAVTFQPQAGRTTERSGVVLAPLETKFLRFETRQEQDSVLSRSPAFA